MKTVALLIGTLIIGVIWFVRPQMDVEELLHAYNVTYYEGEAITACGVEHNMTAFTCGNQIYLGEPWFSNQTNGVRLYVLAHEQGHQIDYYDSGVFLDEQFADCHAGMKLADMVDLGEIGTKDLQQVYDKAREWSSMDHGTSEERIAAIKHGYGVYDCDVYNKL